MWVGLCAVDVEPSPKSHAQAVGAPVEVSAKVTSRGAVPEVGFALNDALGGAGVEGAEPTV